MREMVLDTNVVLDAFLFSDVAALPVRDGLVAGALAWIATQPMRDELQRVLGYRQIVPRLMFHGLSASDILAQFDRHARIVDVVPKACITCKDADDQKFIDLSVAYRALLLSKDAQVLAMRGRLRRLGADAAAVLASPAEPAAD